MSLNPQPHPERLPEIDLRWWLVPLALALLGLAAMLTLRAEWGAQSTPSSASASQPPHSPLTPLTPLTPEFPLEMTPIEVPTNLAAAEPAAPAPRRTVESADALSYAVAARSDEPMSSY